MAHSPLDTAIIRDLLTAAFSDEELTTLCFDHFREVYDNFSSGMSKGQKIQLLLDYCTRREQFDRLLPLVRERNPAQYARYEPRLQAAASGAQSEEAHEKSVSGGVDIHSERTDIGGDVVGRDKITIVVGGQQDASPPESGAAGDESSLRRQLAETRENLRLVDERKAQYVEETSIPLQLVKDERRLRARIAELEARLKDQGGA